ncbi:hypothetical protein OC844_006607 [Tilletia horrida]|nr:hypothetical protein OC844_006607 [Tilletia horrida]
MQEAARLSSTSLNVVGLAGNTCVYLSGPYWAMGGQQRAEASFHSSTSLAFFSFLTGLGNSTAFTAAMYGQAKSWYGIKRGSETAFVLSGFRLSAFFYSTLSRSLCPSSTADYLLLLEGFYILGYFIIHVPSPTDRPIVRRYRTSSSAADGSALDASNATGNAAEHDPEAPGLVRALSSSASRYNHQRSSSDIGARVWLTAD